MKKNQSVGSDMVLGPYKEPLTPVKKGFGYIGAISLAVDGRIQCHICGKLMDNLPKHIRFTHKMSSLDYREKFQIAKTTKLVSEQERLRMKESHFRYWVSLSASERKLHIARAQKGRWAYVKRMGKKAYSSIRVLNLDQKNQRGICPDQLIDLIQKASGALNKTPTMQEFSDHYGTERFFRPIVKTFGSYNAAIKKAGLKPNANYGVYNGPKKRYSDEELLEYLSDFFHREKVLPGMSDFNRGYLPATYKTYLDRFGTIANARRRAGLPEKHTNRGGWYMSRRGIKVT